MKLAIIGDIHGNLFALEAVLKDCINKSVDEYIFLGDYIMDGPYSNEVLDRIKNISSNVIAGNKELYIKNYSSDTINYKQVAVAHWTYNKLRDDNIEYIINLPEKIQLNINGKWLYFSHYPMYYNKHENGIFDMVDVEKIFEKTKQDILVYAHTHRPLEAKMYNRYVISPGSCGLPLAGDNKACYGVITIEETITYEFYSVEYNISKYLSTFPNTGILNECKIWTKYSMKSIKTGKNYSVDFLLFAKDLMKKHKRNNKSLVDNDIWELADKLYDKHCKL